MPLEQPSTGVERCRGAQGQDARGRGRDRRGARPPPPRNPVPSVGRPPDRPRRLVRDRPRHLSAGRRPERSLAAHRVGDGTGGERGDVAPQARSAPPAGDPRAGRGRATGGGVPVRVVGLRVAARPGRQWDDRRPRTGGRRPRGLRPGAARDRHERRAPAPAAGARRAARGARRGRSSSDRGAGRSDRRRRGGTLVDGVARGTAVARRRALGARRPAPRQPARRRRPARGRHRLGCARRRRSRVRPAAGVERVRGREPRTVSSRARGRRRVLAARSRMGPSTRPCWRCRTTGARTRGWSARRRTRSGRSSPRTEPESQRRRWPTTTSPGMRACSPRVRRHNAVGQAATNASRRPASSSSSRRADLGSGANGSVSTRPSSTRHVPATTPSTRNV